MGGAMDTPRYDFVSATFFFFKAFGRRPGSVLWIALWQIVLNSAVAAAALAALWPFLTLIFDYAMSGAEAFPEALLLAHLPRILGAYSLAGLAFILVALMAQGAWLRLMTRDAIAAVIPFRFGFDELRLLGVNLIFIVFALLGWGLAAAVFAVANASIHGGFMDAGVLLGALVNTALVLAAVILGVIIMVRFAAAPALSIRTRRFRLFGSFAATRGVTGWMVLSYLLVMLVGFGIFVVISVIQQIAFVIVLPDLIGATSALDGSEDPEVIFSILADVLTRPAAMVAFGIALTVQILAQLVIEGLWHGVGAYAAVRHDGGETAEAPISAPAESVGAAPAEG